MTVRRADHSLKPEDYLVSDEKVMDRFEAAGQGHVFRFLDRLDWKKRNALMQSARAVDLEQVAKLAEGKSVAAPPAPPQPLAGPFVHRRADLLARKADREAAEEEGRALLRAGKVACVTVAGGQGTRLGFPGPKGCYPIGPGNRTLFDLHAAGVAAAAKIAGRPIPWIVLVSPQTGDATFAYIRRRGLPGVEAASVRMVSQATVPALDDQGKLLLEDFERIATTPDGHGGLFKALRATGTLPWLVNLGIEELCYFQVDNALVPPVDPLFLGLHRRAKGQMSTKVFPKADPAEKVGVVAVRNGRPVVVEYTELPQEAAAARDAGGSLVHWAGNMAAHCLSLPFCAAVAFKGLPLHRVKKKVPFLDERGKLASPPEPNAWKFEAFVFDALEKASGGVVMEVDRAAEFAPVKNASGTDSPETARALLKAAGRW